MTTDMNHGPQHLTNVPMTNPDALLAVHEQSYGHSVSWTELPGGRVLLSSAGTLSVSDDDGLSWSEPYVGDDGHGEPLQAPANSLVTLGDGNIGITYGIRTGADTNRYGRRVCFRRSDDEGRTWSAAVVVNPDQSAYSYQDVLLRTGSGRLIMPLYTSLGQGKFHQQGAPFVGGYVGGRFVSTDAHFYDTHFAAVSVYYSDDEGQTWQRNIDGELLIVLGYGGHYQGVAEPSVCEVAPGKLLMMMRTRLGRLYQAWSDDNGETWTRPQPTQLASTQAPAQVRAFKDTGHLLCVFTQQSEREIRRGFIRTRLSAAISRNGGGVWEHFQNVESLHEQTHVEPGPIDVVKPEGGYPMGRTGAVECDSEYVAPLPVGYGRWSYPSVLVREDRVLISYTYTRCDETGVVVRDGVTSKMKVLPISWFYGAEEPGAENQTLTKLGDAARP